MKILITGGGGFIGFHTAIFLKQKNHDVTVLDNLSNSATKKIDFLLDNEISFFKGDILDYNFLRKVLQNKFDVVIHLAAKIDVEESFLNPELVKQVNINGTENLLRACLENNVKNFIAASSAAVYGNPVKLPITEDQPLNPLSPYGQSKAEMEQIIQKYSKNYDIHSICLRFFNVYGRDQSFTYAGVITKFLEKIRKNKPLIIFGDGSYTRDFIYIEDVLKSIICAIENIKNKNGNCYNIATGNPITIKDLANLILSISKKELEIIHKPAKKGDISYSYADTTLAKRDLKFVSVIGLKNGLQKLMN